MATSPLPSPRPGPGGSADRTDPSSHAGEGAREIERSAGGVVVRIVEGTPHVLLIRDPYRKWGLPKGHLENGEGASEAALREVREETGLDVLHLGPDLGEIDWTFTLRGRRIHKFCRFFLMASPEGEPRPEVAEGITECRWLSLEDALATVAYDNARGVIRWAADRLHELPGGGPVGPVEATD